jgi:hypothetical protein
MGLPLVNVTTTIHDVFDMKVAIIIDNIPLVHCIHLHQMARNQAGLASTLQEVRMACFCG